MSELRKPTSRISLSLTITDFREQTSGELSDEVILEEQQELLLEDMKEIELMVCWRAHQIFYGHWLKDTNCYTSCGYSPVFQVFSGNPRVNGPEIIINLPSLDVENGDVTLEYSLWRIKDKGMQKSTADDKKVEDPDEQTRLQGLFHPEVVQRLIKRHTGETDLHHWVKLYTDEIVAKNGLKDLKDSYPDTNEVNAKNEWAYASEDTLDKLDDLAKEQYAATPNFIGKVVFRMEKPPYPPFKPVPKSQNEIAETSSWPIVVYWKKLVWWLKNLYRQQKTPVLLTGYDYRLISQEQNFEKVTLEQDEVKTNDTASRPEHSEQIQAPSSEMVENHFTARFGRYVLDFKLSTPNPEPL